MYKKIPALIMATLLVLTVFTFAGCETTTEKLPEITVTDETEVAEGVYNIKYETAGTMPQGVEITYGVTSKGNTVSVINGVFMVSKDNVYDVSVTFSFKSETVTKTYTVTAVKSSSGGGETEAVAVLNVPLELRAKTSTFSFGKNKITGLTKIDNAGGSVYAAESEPAELTVSYTVTPIIADAQIDKTVQWFFDGYSAGSAEANAIATLAENKISFVKTGAIKIKLVANADEKAVSEFTVNVNDGYNVYEKQDLRNITAITVGSDEPTPIANILTDIIFDANTDPFQDMFIITYPLNLYGNGYKIDASRVPDVSYPSGTGDAYRNLAVMNFIAGAGFEGVPFTQETPLILKDLTVLANGVYNAVNQNNEPAPNAKDKLCGINISPSESGYNIKTAGDGDIYAYRAEDGLQYRINKRHFTYRLNYKGKLTIENVNVQNTLVGFRLQDINDISFRNVTSKYSYLHNIEIHATENCVLENMKLGFSGGAPIELKENFSTLYRHDMTLSIEEAAMLDGKPMYVPANPYDPQTVMNGYGAIVSGNVLTSGGSKPLSSLTEADAPIYVRQRPANDFIGFMTVRIRGTFECDNWTAGNEAYYMLPGGTPDSSNYIIMKLKQLAPNRVKMINGVEKINYAIGLINWGMENKTNLIIENPEETGFSPVGVYLKDVIPGASWAYDKISYLYVNKA